MREPRKNHGLVFVNDRIYAVGGQNGMGTGLILLLSLTESKCIT